MTPEKGYGDLERIKIYIKNKKIQKGKKRRKKYNR